MKKILITGTDGYIGKALCSSLIGYDITCINREVCDLVDGDKVRTFFEGKYFDVVIHCAAVGGSRLTKDNRSIFKSNISMFDNILYNQSHYGRLIHFGSGAQFKKPLDYYGLSKKLIADMIDENTNFYNIIVYGLFDENELDTRFIKSNVKKCMNGESMVIHKDKYMDFFHMKDLITKVISYIESNSEALAKTYECKYKETYRLTHIVEMIALILGKTAKVEVLEDGLDNPYMSNEDTEKYTSEGLDFEDRLKETIERIK
jgi:nucleoside-diphosphate-sugar epimerase|tara:strand:- start:13481 stop:14260 length:780 start_codon:yes stop_codon:yes gene_type:complete